MNNWEMQIQSVIPLLQLPPNTNQEVDVSELLGDYIAEPFETRCSDPTCKNRIMDAALETQTGCYTILAVNRFYILNPNGKRMNKLMLSSQSRLGQELTRELVSVVCHRGDENRGHFVSYHKVGQQWFLNDDSRPCIPTENPLEQTVDDSETVELLFFKNV